MLLMLFIKLIRSAIVVFSFTVNDAALDPSEAKISTVLCALDMELEIPNSASLESSVASMVSVSFLDRGSEVTYLPEIVSVSCRMSSRLEEPPVSVAF